MALLSRFPVIDRAVERFAYWWAFLGPSGLVWLVMSWVASHWPLIAQYGTGAVIFAGLGAACVLMLIASISLIAWRYFHPLGIVREMVERSTSLEKMPEPPTGSTPWKTDIESIALALEQYVDATSGSLKNDLADAIKAIPWKDDIARLNELGVSQHQINDDLRAKLDRQAGAQAVILAELRNLERKFGFFIKAIRAGDAKRDVLLPNDKTAMVLGKRLAEAKVADYADPASWLSDYQKWRTAVRVIDHLVVNWAEAEGFGGYAPLLDLEPRHFQHSPMPPENIRIDDTIIPFKTVWHAQSSYANQRDGIFSFFETLAALPG